LDNKKRSLHDIINDYQNLESKIIENNGEISDDLEQLLTDNNEDLKSKLDNYEKFIRYLNNQAEYLKNMELHYMKRRKVIEKSIIRLKANVLNAIKITGESSVKTSEFNFSICKSEKWVVHHDILDNDIKSELINNGLAEEVFKPFLNQIKAEYKNNDSKPDWIEIEENEYIKVV